MKPSFFTIAALALGGVCALVPACQRKDKAPSPAPSASNAKPTLPPNVDAALFEQLTTIATTCKVDAAAGSVACDKGENRRLGSDFSSGKRSRPASLATLTLALTDKNPALQTTAANLMNTAFRVPWGNDAKVGSVLAVDAKALLEAATKLPNALAREAVPGAVHAAALAGSLPDAYALLDKADPAEIRPLGYRYVMTHGRLAAFPKVQELAKDSNVAVAFAALEAPRNMYQWDDSEKTAICPWAAELLKDPRQTFATRAAGLLGSCSGEFVDLLLHHGEEALKAGRFGASELGPYRDLCSAATLRQPGASSEKQCERNRKLLSSVLGSKKLESQTRSLALVSLAYQWPDDKTLRLAQSLQKDADKAVAERANATVKRLEERKASEKSRAAAVKKPAQ
jgi:hypothetical protein